MSWSQWHILCQYYLVEYAQGCFPVLLITLRSFFILRGGTHSILPKRRNPEYSEFRTLFLPLATHLEVSAVALAGVLREAPDHPFRQARRTRRPFAGRAGTRTRARVCTTHTTWGTRPAPPVPTWATSALKKEARKEMNSLSPGMYTDSLACEPAQHLTTM